MKKILAILLFFITGNSFAQVNEMEKDLILERTIEFISQEFEDTDIDFTGIIEIYYFLMDNPLNLNQATAEDLKELRLLTDQQINALISYRKSLRKILSIYELNAIPGFDRSTIDRILPFVRIGASTLDQVNWKKAFKYGKHDLMLRYQRVLEEKAGYLTLPDSILALNPNKKYLGDANKYYLRYRYTYKNNLSIGLTAEKDPGEAFTFNPQQKGFDFYSGHVMVQDLGVFKKLVVGDFQVSFGQGLNIWTGFNMGRSAQVLNAKQYGQGLRAYTSVNEGNFMRGVGMSFGENKWQTTLFASYKKVDAVLQNNDSLLLEDYVNTFQLTGYHRTEKELAAKNTIGQMNVGGALSYQTENFKINMTGMYTHFDKNIEGSDLLYNKFDFNGTSQVSIGVDYQYIWHKVSLFGETASALNGKLNTINGVTWHVDPKLDLVVMHRYFSLANQNLYVANFSGSSQNENGIYFGFLARPTSKINVSAYYDQYQSKWLKYLVDGPSVGSAIFFQIDFDLSRYANFYIRYRNKLKERNISSSDASITPQDFEATHHFRLNYSHSVNKNITVKSRFEYAFYDFNKTTSKGIVLFQDVIYKFNKIPLKLYARYAVFDTDDYNSRIYTYENDLLYVFSIPALYNQGFRTYLMGKYEIGRKVDIWVRWSRTTFINEKSLSTGLEEIAGNHRSEIKVQLKFRF
ncbi:hypothetical protein DNU06_00940 [Putridiphycobacter roseus]|uniref:Helix-hairpin-helix domain-containing protein n=1 Tax=Putridiphycobacter roseus TaxID=2219161 RepID=A0A2W1N5L6_9FLAO|nr:helix-hairpin-helix domain-containing protein [Putridiphycobacter roseus]PZE18431.1 hypothetical protein DNU06_00940 [Putridiphycobacter roseus]